MIITDEELVFPKHNLKTINSIRPTLQKQMDDLALQERKLNDKLHKNRNVRVELNPKRLDFITTLFGVGKKFFKILSNENSMNFSVHENFIIFLQDMIRNLWTKSSTISIRQFFVD